MPRISEALHTYTAADEHRPRRRIALTAATALLATGASACVASSTANGRPSQAAPNPSAPASASQAASYYYVAAGARYGESSPYTGASINLTQAAPHISLQRGGHSLAEMFVSGNNGNAIGFGWNVDPRYGDARPHLWIERFQGNTDICTTSACGLVEAPGAAKAPGDALDDGVTGTFGLNYDPQGWSAYYDGRLIGRFPKGTAGTNFTQVKIAAAQGEVTTFGAPPCSEMGDGKFGSDPDAAEMSNFTLTEGNAHVAGRLAIEKVTNAHYYSGRQTSDGSIFYGGPGAGC